MIVQGGVTAGAAWPPRTTKSEIVANSAAIAFMRLCRSGVMASGTSSESDGRGRYAMWYIQIIGRLCQIAHHSQA